MNKWNPSVSMLHHTKLVNDDTAAIALQNKSNVNLIAALLVIPNCCLFENIQDSPIILNILCLASLSEMDCRSFRNVFTFYFPCVFILNPAKKEARARLRANNLHINRCISFVIYIGL